MPDIINADDLSPMMRQYYEVKQQYQDNLVFYRLGDFYELFFEDAKIAANILDLTLTRRNHQNGAPIPMAGIPYHAVDSYIARLLKAGYSVVICEQMSDKQGAGRNMIERKVTRIITPGTVTEPDMIPEREVNIIAALYADKVNFGFATMDLSSGKFTTTEVSSIDDLMLLIDKVNPKELLYPERFAHYERLKDVLCRKALPLWDYDYDSSYRNLCTQFKTQSLLGFGIDKMRAGICAAGALLNYVRTTQHAAVEHVSAIKRDESSHIVLLDKTAQKNLELLSNLSGTPQGCLMAILDDTRTPMGSRLLRSMLVNPLRDNATLEQRYDLIEALQQAPMNAELDLILDAIGDIERIVARIGLRTAKPRDLAKLRDALAVVPTIKYLLTLNAEQAQHLNRGALNQILSVVGANLGQNAASDRNLDLTQPAALFGYQLPADDATPDSAPEVSATAASAQSATTMPEQSATTIQEQSATGAQAPAPSTDASALSADTPTPSTDTPTPSTDALRTAARTAILRHFIAQLPELNATYQLLQRAIKPFPSLLIRDGDVIADGYHDELDELRQLQNGAQEILLAIEEQEKERSGISSLKVKSNNVLGFFIEITRNAAQKAPPLPQDYVRRQSLKNVERYITPELKELEEKTLSAQTRCLQIEKELYEQILAQLIAVIPELSALAAHLAQLDVAQALGRVAQKRGYTRPTLTSDNYLKIVAGRHPVVEALSSNQFISNGIELDPEHNLAVISGPNMGGKSTFMRQTALIAIMARMGSFVSAKEAVIGDIDRIFTRIGASDDLAAGRSTFMVEMEETATILNNASDKSLVIMDEVGRGTSGAEGAAIAEAIVQYLAKDLRPKTMFATHYAEVTTLVENYPNAFNLCFNAKEFQGQIVFLYHAERGRQVRSFGIEVAQLAGVPSKITKKALGFFKARAKELDNSNLFTPPLTSDLAQGLGSGLVPEAAAELDSRNSAEGTHPEALAHRAQLQAQAQRIAQLQAQLSETQAQQAQLEHESQVLQDLARELNTLDLNSLTPLMALNVLSELKSKLSALH
ncbi:MAG TPA: DNA mismatch repair protein MutS [Candidatus Anaerobiospirillum stercoravium]|nr:DNA mismatch repair protein MutS [Candidatus Anaerobiospirillum stercoravium]